MTSPIGIFKEYEKCAEPVEAVTDCQIVRREDIVIETLTQEEFFKRLIASQSEEEK